MDDKKSAVDRSADNVDGHHERKRDRRAFIQESTSMLDLLNQGSKAPDERAAVDRTSHAIPVHVSHDPQREFHYSAPFEQESPDLDRQVFQDHSARYDSNSSKCFKMHQNISSHFLSFPLIKPI